MQETTVYSEGLKHLAAAFDELDEALPEARRQMYEEIGAAVLSRVRANIGGSGKVQGWQDAFVGSKGGYAAVRPKGETYETTPGGKARYAVGYITNAIENGHRQESGWYVPALGKKLFRDRAEGKHFYAAAQREAEQLAYQAAERFAADIRRELEG